MLLDDAEVAAAKLVLDMLKDGTLRLLLLTPDTLKVLTSEEVLPDGEDIAAVDRAGIGLDRILDDGKLLDDGKSINVDSTFDDGKTVEDGTMLDDSTMLDDGKILDVDKMLETLDDCKMLDDCEMLDVDKTTEDGILENDEMLAADRTLDDCIMLEDGTTLVVGSASCEEAATRLVV